jgi:hypothetical protein
VIIIAATALLVVLAWSGCEPKWEQLKLFNRSDRTVKVLYNMFYPDTTLHRAFRDRYIKPHHSAYFAVEWNLHEEITDGISVFLFDYDYFQAKWNEDVGRPNTYLEEDSLLKKWILTRAELDSVDWELYYP